MEKRKVVKVQKRRFVTIPMSELESMEATIETLGNKYVVAQLAASEEAIKMGKVRKARDVLKEL